MQNSQHMALLQQLLQLGQQVPSNMLLQNYLSAVAPNAQQLQPDMMQPGGGMALASTANVSQPLLPGFHPLGGQQQQPGSQASGSGHGAGASGTSQSNQHPRLYDGRIHVPLMLITKHFPVESTGAGCWMRGMG